MSEIAFVSIADSGWNWQVAVAYAFLLRVQLLCCFVLIGLPLLAFYTGARSLLRGLFDLTPLSLFTVVLTTLAVSGSACATASIVLAHGSQRFGLAPLSAHLPSPACWLALMAILPLSITLFSIVFSIRQNCGLWRKSPLQGATRILHLSLAASYVIAALAAFVMGLGISWWLILHTPALSTRLLHFLPFEKLEAWLQHTGLFAGYVKSANPTDVAARAVDPLLDHASAIIMLAAALALYMVVGVYGGLHLGKTRTVPALASALMVLLLLTWMLSGLAFFFDAWRIPTLLIVAIIGFITAQSEKSDHYYDLIEPQAPSPAPPPPSAVLLASGARRIIAVAANGGGIQSSAWTAKVLQELSSDCSQFTAALRVISSVSGGSVGAMYFANSCLLKQNANNPIKAACESSIDEVAWGLAWPDLLRGLFPWFPVSFIGRGRALELAWSVNGALSTTGPQPLGRPLREWNAKVLDGQVPALIMNATVAETGKRLLLASTDVSDKQLSDKGQVDAATLHCVDGQEFDIAIVTAARLSATFPYVTPASRAKAPGLRPHVVDGGYYDNYGMASLVGWLDAGLAASGEHVQSVLVLQIHGAASETRDEPKQGLIKQRGWFYQLFAPLTTLAAVRSSGQVAHNDIELSFLQQKWTAAGAPIHSVTFEFSDPRTPLSWHLTPQEIAAIENAWDNEMTKCRQTVSQFLAGSDNLDCGCPFCRGEKGNPPIR